MSARAHRRPVARLLGTLVLALGALLAVSGVATWIGIGASLAQEEIHVSEDAPAFAGQLVDTPWEAWAQTEAIKGHAFAESDGRTYAELDRDDPARPMVQTAAFLRASLMTSVTAFGVALLVVGVGTGFLLVGGALRSLAAPPADAATAPGASDDARPAAVPA
jgi:hypothetical protein